MTAQADKPKIDDRLLPALQKVTYPGFDADIISMNLVLEARLEGERALIKTRPVAADHQTREELENRIAAALGQVAGVQEMVLDMPAPPKGETPAGPQPVEGVKTIVPVASGKGGVGKSTVAVNLALGLAGQGLQVGLLDLDLYGPSLPTMLGLQGAQPTAQGEKLAPIIAHGIKVLSIGFMVGAEQALIWRGPLIMKAVRQLFHEVAWAPLDVLVLDLPPGTGDVQITMAQEVPIFGAVVVTTPQDVALLDAIKAVDMFKNTNAPVLGIVENMSYFVCPDCGSRHEIFGHGTVEPLCKRLGVDYLGELPLDTQVRLLMDQGRPLAAESAPGKPYQDLAAKVAAKIKETL